MSRIRVLLVDDSAPFLEALEGLLSTWPEVEVIASTQSGRAAVDYMATDRPDLVLVDLYMSDTDGLTTTRLIKGGRDAPFVFVITLHDEPGVREAALAAGADALLCKAELPTQLRSLIQQSCSGS